MNSQKIVYGDRVITPLGRSADVIGYSWGRVICRYIDDLEEVALLPRVLVRDDSLPKHERLAQFRKLTEARATP